MVSGSDMHGTPVTVRAEREALTPLEIANRYHEINLESIEDMDIDYDLFTKTHTDNHFEVVHDIFLTLLERDHLYKKETFQYFCAACDRFLPDRYVEGVCPYCGAEEAKGDQCDNCGKTFEAGSLRDVECTNCGSAPELRETEHYFFRLSSFQEELLRYVSDKAHWKQNVLKFTENWLEGGLEDRAITRDMTWGVPVPLEGWEDKVIYVWFEAVIGYLSASIEWAKRKGSPEMWKEFWKNPDARHYYFLGKDNIPFHTIIWPAILMGYGGLELPYDVPANEFLTFKGEQFSKSRGVSIDIPSVLNRFDSDIVRYYIAANMPENRDADFSWSDFETRVNNELVATLGNYYHRVISFIQRHFGEVPPYAGSEGERQEVTDRIGETREIYDRELSGCHFKNGLKSIMELAKFGNQYFDRVAPWSLIKEDEQRCGSVLNLNLEIVKALAVLSYPFMPRSSRAVWKMLGYNSDVEEEGWGEMEEPIVVGQSLSESEPQFSKVEIKEVEEDEEDNVFGDMEKLDLRVGKITTVKEHPNADKLIILEVDIGKEIELVAGLKGYYGREELEGKKIVVVSNLQPARLRGVLSQGMLLAAERDDDVVLLTPAGDASPGDRVNSGMSSSNQEIDFSSFQDLTMVVGSPTQDKKLNIGREVELKDIAGLEVPRKLAVFMPSPDAGIALPLFTEGKVAITVDSEIGDGAAVK